jgi:hypothetical protein
VVDGRGDLRCQRRVGGGLVYLAKLERRLPAIASRLAKHFKATMDCRAATLLAITSFDEERTGGFSVRRSARDNRTGGNDDQCQD